MRRLYMVVNYDLEKIEALLSDFYTATGVSMDMLTSDFVIINSNSHSKNNPYCRLVQCSAKGKNTCVCSDADLLMKCKDSKKPKMHICPAGLTDVASPVLYNDTVIGYIMFGQMRTTADFSCYENYLMDLGLDKDLMREHYNKTPFYNSDAVNSLSNIACVLAKHILIEDMLRLNFDEKIDSVIRFIDLNLEGDLSIQTIERKTNVSKSVLYKKFLKYFGCTVSEYINKRRIEKAIEYLKKTDWSLEEISQRVGFSSASYFGETFKKQKGISPLKYKKSLK
jgi:AraC-like DNA-binding protein